MKRDKRDAIFSNLVRERAGWTCENEGCGKYYPEGQRQGLHCSHFFGRRYRSTRWHPDNAAAHCFSCHQKLGENRVDFTAWISQHLGDIGRERIRHLSQIVARFSKRQLEDIYWHMKDQHKAMLAKRANGETGRIEFDPAPALTDLESAARMQ